MSQARRYGPARYGEARWSRPRTQARAVRRELSVEPDNAVGVDDDNEHVARGEEVPGSRLADTDDAGALPRLVPRVPPAGSEFAAAQDDADVGALGWQHRLRRATWNADLAGFYV